ncbi:hypothetical protein DL770_000785 [Monosporascus sp. CRB-9-2]|nr:hypothetical protein DL770_000785 [Monosporascus sp. CRB-9-2]
MNRRQKKPGSGTQYGGRQAHVPTGRPTGYPNHSRLSQPPQQRPSRESRHESDDNSADTGRMGVDDVDQDDADYDDSSVASPFPHPGARFRQPMKVINWRGELCRLLNLDVDAPDDDILEELQRAETILEEAQRVNLGVSEPENLTPRAQVIFRIKCYDSRERSHLYLEEPWISESGPYGSHLRAGSAIRNFELFLERGRDISFLIYKDFECCRKGSQRSAHGCYDDSTAEISRHFLGESISIVSDDLASALRQLAEESLNGIPHPKFETGVENGIVYPYLWWFHRRAEISEAATWLDPTGQQHIGIFRDYLQHRLGDEWKTVDSLISRGRISVQYIEYLFAPNTILISKLNGEKHAQIEGFLAGDWLNPQRKSHSQGSDLGRAYTPAYSISCTHWTFDGNFQKRIVQLPITIPSMEEDFKITDLTIYPSKFADEGLRNALQERGEMYWKCRRKRYVCCNDDMDESFHNTADQRFMVDITMYKQMHPPDPDEPPTPKRDDLGPKKMSQDKPPKRDDFLMCLPTTIPGFNMQKKEWVNLEVSNLRDVEWNKEAFDLLVADKETKELVRALVENQCNTERNTDLIGGKGNGLFVLLHGVAEIAEKPLYRVTCGDIGTKAEDVEKYLETVLLLGKTWGCVVLLDEADVFLEERSLYDLQRNALVSGILILTSNRVAIFDEAFKSRMQLTLRYKNLEEPQRKAIWHNLISRLQKHHQARLRPTNPHNNRRVNEHEIDADEIRANVDKLARAELNGRQIRNAVSTARQLAMFHKLASSLQVPGPHIAAWPQ